MDPAGIKYGNKIKGAARMHLCPPSICYGSKTSPPLADLSVDCLIKTTISQQEQLTKNSSQILL